MKTYTLKSMFVGIGATLTTKLVCFKYDGETWFELQDRKVNDHDRDWTEIRLRTPSWHEAMNEFDRLKSFCMTE